MNPVLRRVLFSLAVLFWAGVMLYFYGSGRIAKYLAPDFRAVALFGGMGLAVLGAFNLLTAGQKADCGHDHDEDEEDVHHDHEASDMNPWMVLVLMVLPVGFAVAWTKDEYSQGALARKGLYDSPGQITSPFLAASMSPLTMEDIESSHRRTADGFLEFSLLELFFSSGDPEMMGLIGGLKVETEGRIVEEKMQNPNGTRMRLYRLFMTCCVADSRAIPIVLEFGRTPPPLPDNGWVKVAGTMTFPEENGMIQAVLEVERATAAEEPAEESFLRN